MSELYFQSKIEQVAAHLRQQIMDGKWEKVIPGRQELALDLGASNKTVESALQLLESDGVLIPQGAGRRRKIACIQKNAPIGLRIKTLVYENTDRNLAHHVELQRRLGAAGHKHDFAEKTLLDLSMDVKRVAKFVESTETDAWIVTSGSDEILQWFAQQPKPVIAQFGRFDGIPIAAAGVRKIPAMTTTVSKLVALGHRRIVMLSREERRKPTPAPYEQAFLDELKSHRIHIGTYHLPDWQDNIKSFHRCIDSLFGSTPPTAMIISEAPLYFAAMHHLAQRGLVTPKNISLICDDPDICFSWCVPSISHLFWDSRPVVNRIAQWANNIAKGKSDLKQVYTQAEFIEGGTMGPVPV
jgi:DNA-binding LacI/PurR family transcriptional regulator/DNA-binding transcriptional regulator YhcF (GntR family)